MKLSWLMGEFMSCQAKPVQIRMGLIAYKAFLEMFRDDTTEAIMVTSRHFGGVRVIPDSTMVPDSVYFITRISEWTPS